MAKSHVLGQEPGVGTEEQSYEADEQFEHAPRLGTPVALATKRKPLYNHEYGVFGRDRVAVVVDHFSRAVQGFAVFLKRPTSTEIQHFLNRAIRNVGGAPKHVISDKGTQFWCDSFKDWCTRRRIRPRFGAVKKYGSISVVERFIRSMKSECTRRSLVPLALGAMRCELAIYVAWFNEYRPSQAL